MVVAAAARAAATPGLDAFTPSGAVKGARQASARFATPMVAFADLAPLAPFTTPCAGRGRWVDQHTWVYDLDLPPRAGERCAFTPRAGLVDLAGAAVPVPAAPAFDGGGPGILASEPWDGSTIDEEQVFLLGLDGAVDRASIEAHVHCQVDGLLDAVGVRVLDDDERRTLLAGQPWFLRRFAAAWHGEHFTERMQPRSVAEEGAVAARYGELLAPRDGPLVALTCRQRLPNGARVTLLWGAGVATPGGVHGSVDQALEFEVREAFRARVQCERVNRDAGCVPALPLRLEFTAPVRRELAAAVTLVDGDGRSYPQAVAGDDDAWLTALSFPGPFPPRASLTLALPADFRDDAGRTLVNAARFPRAVRFGEDPPLARFAAAFGIIEHGPGAALPITVRNLEPNRGAGTDATARDAAAAASAAAPSRLRGRVLSLPADDIAALGRWSNRVSIAQQDAGEYDEERGEYVIRHRAGELSLLAGESRARELVVPRAAPARALEVVGIALPEPGLHLVEVASPRLGASLFGKPSTYYVQSLALVTNIGVHFKWGRESSLAWVTALDSGRPLPFAAVKVHDCRGTVLWRGQGDASGVAAIRRALPRAEDLPECEWNSRGLVVSARLGRDVGLVSSTWNEGIANWQFNLPGPGDSTPELAHAVFDRVLLRAGETLGMKLFLRRHGSAGLDAPRSTARALRVRHAATGDVYDLAPAFAPDGASATAQWAVPAPARLGTYVAELGDGTDWRGVGEFHVEAFRVPLLAATLDVPPGDAVGLERLPVTAHVDYLAGGGAAALPVELHGTVEPRALSFPGYEGIEFMNGDVTTGLAPASDDAPWRYQDPRPPSARPVTLASIATTLDAAGAARFELRDLPGATTAQTLVAELEYADPNGEHLTRALRIPLWPAAIALGIQPRGWAAARERVEFTVQALDLRGAPAADVAVTVDLFQRRNYSHRKRLIGGFYAYEHRSEVVAVAGGCAGRTDAAGRLHCVLREPPAGNLILRARAADDAGRTSVAQRDVWVAGKDDWWFAVGDTDRMDLVPEQRRYEPGETARVQVRMPFRRATALVTVEREGILDRFVTELRGDAPVVEIPIRAAHGPNVFVSVLAVRGRDGAIAPTATTDLGRPAYRLGMVALDVGWRAHTLDVRLTSPRDTWRVRETVPVTIAVSRADGRPLAAGAEVAVAAVDEGLLELLPNASWDVLEAMMARRGSEVHTATAQMQVVGKRHYGRKAVAAGGGGGRAGGTRELFDTLLTWQARVALDGAGRATVNVPLNDSLSAFRIVAIAADGLQRFGRGDLGVRTHQEVMLVNGLPPVVRQGDRLHAAFTVRNAGSVSRRLLVRATYTAGDVQVTLPEQAVELAAGAAGELSWPVDVPAAVTELAWRIEARDAAGAALDALVARQQVQAAVPVGTWQAALRHLDHGQVLPVAPPANALPGTATLELAFLPRLAADDGGVREFMAAYPFQCLEQLASRAVALDDRAGWDALMDTLPAYLDERGFARYFRSPGAGSEVLTSYLLALAAETGYPLPEASHTRLRAALVDYIEGRAEAAGPAVGADRLLRRLAAIDALSRDSDGIDAAWLDGLAVDVASWPASALIDYIGILRRAPQVADAAARRAAALAALEARLDRSSLGLRFSDEAQDALWWLMVDADVNANRALLEWLADEVPPADIAERLLGSLDRRQGGHWRTTVANAWGALALRRFAARVEGQGVTGTSSAVLGAARASHDWHGAAQGATAVLAWPDTPATLELDHQGDGAPWVSLRARAAAPLTAPVASGYVLERRVTPLGDADALRWRRGDRYRVELTVDASADMAWVVVEDPLPAGASVVATATALGEGVGADLAPTHEERSFSAYRAYYAWLPRGRWRLAYDARMDAAGRLQLPPSRVEAMYAPDLHGALPNAAVDVAP